MLKQRTIVPHIIATRRIISGDTDLLHKMFAAGEFDILKAPPIADNLPEEYRVLLGQDDIELLGKFDVITYSQRNDEQRQLLIDHVHKHLIDERLFLSQPIFTRRAQLERYLDILERIEHQYNRDIWFSLIIAIPAYKTYSRSRQFLFFRKKSIKNTFLRIQDAIEKYAEAIPDSNYMPQAEFGGIQKAL